MAAYNGDRRIPRNYCPKCHQPHARLVDGTYDCGCYTDPADHPEGYPPMSHDYNNPAMCYSGSPRDEGWERPVRCEDYDDILLTHDQLGDAIDAALKRCVADKELSPAHEIAAETSRAQTEHLAEVLERVCFHKCPHAQLVQALREAAGEGK